VGKLLKGEPLPQDALELCATMRIRHVCRSHTVHRPASAEVDEPAADAGVNKLPVNQQNLKAAWETTDRAKAEDWREWMKRLSVQLLKSSPSHSLRACANLAEVYQPLARDLFNAAFVSVWGELYDAYQV
jgi:FKBP12-rapamycin complex-associated protein